MDHHDRYLELLSDGDLAALGRFSGHGPGESDIVAWFRRKPERIGAALDDARTAEALFGLDRGVGPRGGAGSGPRPMVEGWDTVTPVLVFAAIIHRGAGDIGDIAHVPERFGSGLVVPVFDGEQLARFASSQANRLFLVELLGSYTKVMSGPQWVRSRGRWRRRRFSEMNPAQLAAMAADIPLEDRAGAYRRLGDLALFLNGVFPDHSVRLTLSSIELERILRSIPDHHRDRHRAVQRLLTDRVDGVGPVLAALGPLWYQLAADLVSLPTMSAQLAHVAERFDQARRFLSFTTDRWLWNQRDKLFPSR